MPEPTQETAGFAESVGRLEERLGPQLERAKEQLAETNQKMKSVIRAHPIAFLLGSLALGYCVGRLASR